MTVEQLIKSSLRLIGAIDPGEPLKATDGEDSLEALQNLLDYLGSKSIAVYAQTTETFTLTTATSYTIGSGGDFNTVRPDQIAGAYVTVGGVDYDLDPMDAGAYRRIPQKSISATPSRYFYSPEYPLGKIYLDCAPNGGTITVDSLKPLTSYTDLSTTISLPAGYKDMLKYNLAVALAPEYGRQVPPEIATLAVDRLNTVLSRNFASKIETVKLEVLKVMRRYSVEGG